MKKTQRIDLWTTIKRSMIPFISVTIFVALGIALYAGLSWTCINTDCAIDQTCQDTLYENMRVSYPYGMSEEKMDELRQVENVDDAEGYNSVYRFFVLNGQRQQAMICQLTERITAPMNVEGILPSAENEIAVLRSYAEKNGISIGDSITFTDEYGSDYRQLRTVENIAEWDVNSDVLPDTEADDSGYLKTNTFTVTALVDSSDYLLLLPSAYGVNTMNAINVDAVMYVSKTAMAPELFNGYTFAAIYSESLSELSGTDYTEASSALKEKIEALTDTWTDVQDGYKQTLTDLGQKLDDAEAQLKDAAKAIEEKEQELNDGEQQIEDGKAELTEKEKEYEEGAAALAAKEKEYEDGAAALAAKEKEYEDGKTQYEEKLSDYNTACVQYAESQTKYDLYMSDLQAIKTLKEDIASFIHTVQTEASDDAKREAMNTVKNDAKVVCDILVDQKAELLDLLKQAGEVVDIDEGTRILRLLINCSTVEEMQTQIESARAWIEDVPQKLTSMMSDTESKLATARTQLEAARIQLEAAQAQLDAAEKQLEEARTQLKEARTQLDAAEKQLEEARQTLDEGKAQLEEAEELAADGHKQLEDACAELTEKQTEYEEGREQERKLKDALETVEAVTASIVTRSDNISLTGIKQIRNVVSRVKTVLASLFLIVAVLVGFSTLSRMVSDSIPLLGTKKSLGFGQWELLRLYLLYAVLAVGIGSLLGIAGAYGVEAVFLKNFSNTFLLNKVPLTVNLTDIILPGTAELLLLSAAVILAAEREISRNTIDLLKNSEDAGNGNGFLQRLPGFRKLSLLNQIIFNNLVKDKKRVAGMLIGIGGAALLITTGLTVWRNMAESFNSEFTRYMSFDIAVEFDSDDQTAEAEVRKLLDQYGVSYAEVYYTRMSVKDPSGNSRFPHVFVPVNAESLSNVMTFETDSGEKTDFTEGFWLSGCYEEKSKLKQGDLVTLKTIQGTSAETAVTGFFRCYMNRLIAVMDKDTYESEFSQLKPNAFLVSLEGMDAETMQEELNQISGYICSVSFREDAEKENTSVMPVIIMSSGVFVLMAILLAIMVTVNLMSVYISEKKRELIVLIINGYPKSYAKRYIWMDTVILTIAGVVLGLILGTALGNFTQNVLEGETMYLRRGISWESCAAAAVAVSVIALATTFVQIRKIDRFHLSDINN